MSLRSTEHIPNDNNRESKFEDFQDSTTIPPGYPLGQRCKGGLREIRASFTTAKGSMNEDLSRYIDKKANSEKLKMMEKKRSELEREKIKLLQELKEIKQDCTAAITETKNARNIYDDLKAKVREGLLNHHDAYGGRTNAIERGQLRELKGRVDKKIKQLKCTKEVVVILFNEYNATKEYNTKMMENIEQIESNLKQGGTR
eukprot:CAMPEP_0171445500 /NCGR_PEP_ID=MMETSP0881-20121228/36088_1 /TAXON_ID=67004 /ORGANISM="Thalassiosira weissflogii, Strain CCMP1336" /LENGTH=200 /DNA_ID=CAMNT_0011969517 /DNA_START=91 /DNA_END=689 /DNA_ORIENTATION=-